MDDICCIGHITLDKIVTPRKTTYMPGGTSYYFSHGISHLKDTKHYQLVTALAPSEFKAVEDIRAKGIRVTVIPSQRTVYFENTYGENQDNRSQRVLAKADPFTVEQLQNINAHIFHLGSLLADDFSLDVVKYLSEKGILAVDAQGYLREVRGERVYPIDWTDKLEDAEIQLLNFIFGSKHFFLIIILLFQLFVFQLGYVIAKFCLAHFIRSSRTQAIKILLITQLHFLAIQLHGGNLNLHRQVVQFGLVVHAQLIQFVAAHLLFV